MPEHPDFTIHVPPLSTQQIHIQNGAGDIVRLIANDYRDRALLTAAIKTTLVVFEVLKKKGD